MSEETDRTTAIRNAIARVFTRVEDLVYIGMGGVLAVCAVVLLASTIATYGRGIVSAGMPGPIISVLDRLLLVLIIVELLYTVQVSFRERTVAPEPFLIVALVAAIRRILVLTAEFTDASTRTTDMFRLAMIELGVLTAMILALVGSLFMLRVRGGGKLAKRA